MSLVTPSILSPQVLNGGHGERRSPYCRPLRRSSVAPIVGRRPCWHPPQVR